MGAQTVMTPPRLPIRPGAEASAQLTVTNTGRVVDSFALEVLGPAGAWSACEPATVSLLPGQSETVQVIFRPPAGGDVAAGPLLFGVHARSHEDPNGSVVVEGVLDVEALPLVSAEISPRTGRARGRRSSKHQVAVDNRGNAAVLVTLTGFDEQDAVDVTVDPPQVEVAAGAAAFVTVRARGVHRFWRGPGQTHPFSVVAQPSPGDAAVAAEPVAPVRLNATLLQEAAIPSWLPKAMMAAAALAVAFALFWYGMFKPTIKDTATAAAEHAAKAAISSAAASSAAGGGGSGAGGGGSGGGGSATPTPSPTPTPTPSSGSSKPSSKPSATPKPSASPVPFATQLAGADKDLVAAPGKQISVTDLVLQNPAADDGLLTITGAGGKKLMTVRLSDFRDYDLHFVTPIVVPSGQSLSMDVTCQNAAPKSPTCTASVFVSGVTTSVSP